MSNHGGIIQENLRIVLNSYAYLLSWPTCTRKK